MHNRLRTQEYLAGFSKGNFSLLSTSFSFYMWRVSKNVIHYVTVYITDCTSAVRTVESRSCCSFSLIHYSPLNLVFDFIAYTAERSRKSGVVRSEKRPDVLVSSKRKGGPFLRPVVAEMKGKGDGTRNSSIRRNRVTDRRRDLTFLCPLIQHEYSRQHAHALYAHSSGRKRRRKEGRGGRSGHAY